MKNYKYHCCLVFAVHIHFLDIFLIFLRGLNFVDNSFAIFRVDDISWRKSESAKSAKYYPRVI